MLRLENVCFQYRRGLPILNEVSFTMAEGEAVSLLGPNGAGKTTLMRCILGLLPLRAGRVYLCGQDITMLSVRKRARLVSYVPQSSMLAFPYLAQEVVLMGRVAHLGLGASPGTADHKAAFKAMEAMDILHLAERPFQRLSGGEKQLVVIARALAQQAPLMILDEPTASLDFFNQARALKLVRTLAQSGQTILMTTHAPDHAFLIADKVVMMKAGKIFACGPPAETVTEQNLLDLYGIKTVVFETTGISAGKPVKTCVPIIE